MAAFSFSKALKFLEVAQNVTIQVQGSNGAANSFQVIGEGAQQPFATQPEKGGDKKSGNTAASGDKSAAPADSPHEYISNLNSQRSAEILYNFGLALFKDKKYLQAFRNFEKSSNQLKGNPKLWYYLGLSVMHLNKEVEQTINKNRESETYREKYGFNPPNFEKESG